MIIVSACLAGINCRFDGKNKPNSKIMELVQKGEAIPVCPEVLGGLPAPRDPQEIINDRVITIKGEDVTEQFEKGAKEVLRICKEHGCKKAILKSKSPSCGLGQICDGTFSGKMIEGDGITARLLRENGIEVISSDDI